MGTAGQLTLNLKNGCGFETSERRKKVTKTTNRCIKVYYQNVRGLRTKTKTFYQNLLSSNCDLFAITESGLNDGINDGELIPPSFSVLRCDRTDG